MKVHLDNSLIKQRTWCFGKIQGHVFSVWSETKVMSSLSLSLSPNHKQDSIWQFTSLSPLPDWLEYQRTQV